VGLEALGVGPVAGGAAVGLLRIRLTLAPLGLAGIGGHGRGCPVPGEGEPLAGPGVVQLAAGAGPGTPTVGLGSLGSDSTSVTGFMAMTR
jgi:hypothetical protein